jgi:hypothetical protein
LHFPSIFINIPHFFINFLCFISLLPFEKNIDPWDKRVFAPDMFVFRRDKIVLAPDKLVLVWDKFVFAPDKFFFTWDKLVLAPDKFVFVWDKLVLAPDKFVFTWDLNSFSTLLSVIWIWQS